MFLVNLSLSGYNVRPLKGSYSFLIIKQPSGTQRASVIHTSEEDIWYSNQAFMAKLPGCETLLHVTLGKLFNLTAPQFAHL